MKGIYLGAFLAHHDYNDLIYQDINGERDIGGDMLDIDLSMYDYIIATPPCNYYSRANYRRDSSDYSLTTKHLLPCILIKLYFSGKPFIVENVQNAPLFSKFGLFSFGLYIYRIGRHTYWTNVSLDLDNLRFQEVLTDYNNGKKRYLSSQNLPRYKRQGGQEVHEVIDVFLKTIHDSYTMVKRW